MRYLRLYSEKEDWGIDVPSITPVTEVKGEGRSLKALIVKRIPRREQDSINNGLARKSRTGGL